MPGSAPSRSLAYRPDIDGLRAVAVALVVAFHYGIATVSGGFVGVDVFFVISGYLITAITAAELRAGTFAVTAFYGRRLRRILPALFVLLAACGAASVLVFLPADLRLVGTSLVRAALFASNLWFASLAEGYFDIATLAQQPLLHTWSLAVEGQFYLLFPLLPILARRLGLSLPALVLPLLAASFATSLWGVGHAPVATFYLLPARAWELLLGSALALAPPRVPAWAAAPGTFLGLVLILAAALGYDHTTPFPGPFALLPCVGAGLVAWSGAGPGGARGPGGWLLRRTPMVALGRVSYSLYLWHWPLLVLARYGRADDLGPAERAVLLALACGLAALSWRFVERPTLARAVLPGRRALALGAALGTLALVGVGLLVEAVGRGLVPFARLPAPVLALAEGEFDRLEGECRPEDLAGATALPCRFGAAGADPTVAVWGNSYARMWLPALDRDALEAGVAGVALLLSKCPPLLEAPSRDLSGCAAFNRDALAYLVARPALRTLVLGANWFAFDDGLEAGLDRTLAALAGRGLRVAVVLAPPQASYAVPRTLALAELRHAPPPPPIDEARARDAQRRSTDVIAALRRRYAFTVVDPAEVLCDGRVCAVERDGRALYSDAGHVTRSAAAAAAALFMPAVRP